MLDQAQGAESQDATQAAEKGAAPTHASPRSATHAPANTRETTQAQQGAMGLARGGCGGRRDSVWARRLSIFKLKLTEITHTKMSTHTTLLTCSTHASKNPAATPREGRGCNRGWLHCWPGSRLDGQIRRCGADTQGRADRRNSGRAKWVLKDRV